MKCNIFYFQNDKTYDIFDAQLSSDFARYEAKYYRAIYCFQVILEIHKSRTQFSPQPKEKKIIIHMLCF